MLIEINMRLIHDGNSLIAESPLLDQAVWIAANLANSSIVNTSIDRILGSPLGPPVSHSSIGEAIDAAREYLERQIKKEQRQ